MGTARKTTKLTPDASLYGAPDPGSVFRLTYRRKGWTKLTQSSKLFLSEKSAQTYLKKLQRASEETSPLEFWKLDVMHGVWWESQAEACS